MTTPVSTTGAKPISFTQYIWGKCKSQPLIPIGTSSRQRARHGGLKLTSGFRYRSYLCSARWSDLQSTYREPTASKHLPPSPSFVRIPLGSYSDADADEIRAQGATVLAMVIYGSVAITREQQQAHYIKTQKTLGDLPADTVVPEASGRIGTSTPDFDNRRPTKHVSTDTALDLTIPEEEPAAPSYPLAKKDRMKVSDFAKRLREAEKMTAREDEEAKPKKV